MDSIFVRVIGIHSIFDKVGSEYDFSQLSSRANSGVVDEESVCYITADKRDELFNEKYKDANYIWTHGKIFGGGVGSGGGSGMTLYADSGITIDGDKISVNIASGLTFQDDGGLKTVYQPADSSLTTMALGGIAAGTSASTLMGKTVSEVLDDLLFPTYIGKYTSGNAPTLSGGGGTYYIYDTPPAITLNTTASGGGYGTASKVVSGKYTATQTGPTVPENIPQFSSNVTNTVGYGGKSTGNYNVKWGESDEHIVDTKGKDCIWVSSGSTTYLRSNAEKATGQTKANLERYSAEYGSGEQKYWKLSGETRSAKATIYVVYPYWAKTSSRPTGSSDITGGAQESSPITSVPSSYFSLTDKSTASAFTFNGPAESSGNKVSFLLPSTFTNVKMIMEKQDDHSYPDSYAQSTTTQTVWIKLEGSGKTENGNDWPSAIQYTLYTKNTTDSGASNYKITFTR